MTALPEEIEGAVAEGIEVQTLKSPSRIVTDENGHVQGLYVTPQMISKIKDGRASVRPTGEEDQFIPCTTLIVAIGQDIEFQHFEEAGVPVQRGRIMSEKNAGFENIPGVLPVETAQPVLPPSSKRLQQQRLLQLILMNILDSTISFLLM